MTDHQPTITTEICEGVGWLRFARPPVNAFTWTMLGETRAAFDNLHADPSVRVIVLGSAIPSHTSAGADLTVFRDASSDDMRRWVDDCHALARVMRASDKPILAAIKGVAVGGGLEICLHADMRFACRNARLGQPEVNIAFIPPVAGTQALVRLVGRSAAFRMLYTGEVMTAAKALDINLVDEVSAPGAVDHDVQAFAAALAKRPANALASIRRCLVGGGALDFDSGMAVEAAEAARLSDHPNFREGIDAFLTKRAPRWVGDT